MGRPGAELERLSDKAELEESRTKLQRQFEAEVAKKGPVDPNRAKPDMDLYLIAFNDGSYKKVRSRNWKHSQWLHFTLEDGSIVRVNPANVNYMHQGVSE